MTTIRAEDPQPGGTRRGTVTSVQVTLAVCGAPEVTDCRGKSMRPFEAQWRAYRLADADGTAVITCTVFGNVVDAYGLTGGHSNVSWRHPEVPGWVPAPPPWFWDEATRIAVEFGRVSA